MAGLYLIHRAFSWNNRWYNNLQSRWGLRSLIKNEKQFEDAWKEYQKLIQQHELKEIEEKGEEALLKVVTAFKKFLFMHFTIFNWVDNDYKVLPKIINSYPDTKHYLLYLKELREAYKEDKEVVRALDNAEKTLKHAKVEIERVGEQDLQRVYREELNLIKAVETPDRATLIAALKDLARTEGNGIIEYIAIRSEVKGEIREYGKIKKDRDNAERVLRKFKDAAEGRGKKVFSPKDIEEFVDEMNKIMIKSSDEIKKVLLLASKAAVRCVIIMYTLVLYLNKLYEDQTELAARHDIPLSMAEKMQKEIEDLLKQLDKDVRESIQALHAEEDRIKSLAA